MSYPTTFPVKLSPKRALEIIQPVADDHGVYVTEMIGPSINRKVSRARHAAMAALRAVSHPDGSARYSWPDIGKVFRRHHATAMLGVHRHLQRERLSNDRQDDASPDPR